MSAGGNVNLAPGGDATLRGAEVTAGGDVELAADGDVTVAAVQDITTVDRSVPLEREGFLGFLVGSDQTTTEQHQSVTTTGGGITAGGNIGVTSTHGDIVLDAATLAADGAVDLATLDGSVPLSTNVDSDFERRTRDTESLLWWTSSDARSSTESVVHSMIQAGGGLDITTSEGLSSSLVKPVTFPPRSTSCLRSRDLLGWTICGIDPMSTRKLSLLRRKAGTIMIKA